jgi:hypothetical protein
VLALIVAPSVSRSTFGICLFVSWDDCRIGIAITTRAAAFFTAAFLDQMLHVRWQRQSVRHQSFLSIAVELFYG